MKNGGDVVLNAQVTRVTHTDHDGKKGVIVEYRDAVSGKSTTIHCDHTIVSVPPALISNISFSPPLPAQRAVMYQRMPMGCVIKFIFVYK